MSELILSREQVRAVDRLAVERYGMTGLVLMENAGRGCADALLAAGAKGPVAIACGKGNNGGDGFVIARHLDNAGLAVRVLLFGSGDQLTGDAAANYWMARKSGLAIDELSGGRTPSDLLAGLADAEWIVDALLGTGFSGEPRPPLDEAIDAINAAAARRMAIDLPSGLDCDTGRPAVHTVRAELTCTLAAIKPGFTAPEAKPYLGAVQVVDIGVPRRLLEEIGRG